MLPRVSVVLPCRNAAEWLPAALASLKQQEGVELELIVVDDGSTDQSIPLLKRLWQDSLWPMSLLDGCGRGVSAARNLGWRAAGHSLVAFLDADDIAYPERLCLQASLFALDPDLQHVLCGWRRIDIKGDPIVEVCPWEEGAGFGLSEALRHKAVLPSAWMLRRQALEAVGGFDESLFQAEDVDLLLRLARLGAKGTWLRKILCDYRVHLDGASQRVRDQARGLTYVLERHLTQLEPSPEHERLSAEVRYGTRAWLGWYAWAMGHPMLAYELWSTALGLSPFPPGLTWVHLAENVVRSAQRIGEPSQIHPLLRSEVWHRLQQRWWRSRDQPLLLTWTVQSAGLNWGLIFRGQWQAAFLAWAEQLRAEKKVIASYLPQGKSLESYLDVLRQPGSPQGRLSALRQKVLDWCQLLSPLNFDFATIGSVDAYLDELRKELARILALWIEIVWAEDQRPAQTRLEQWVALYPQAPALEALARLQSIRSTAGAEALDQLARAIPEETFGIDHPSPDIDINIPTYKAYWECMPDQPNQCHGPQCKPCIDSLLRDWRQVPCGINMVKWQPLELYNASSEIAEDAKFCTLPMGEAWLRPPSENAWNSTHAYAVADSTGRVLKEFSRRYPHPIGSACPSLCVDPEPRPVNRAPQFVDATVIALVGLSGETYYHWLLEILPLLSSLERQILSEDQLSLVIWHNGGSASYVQETVQSVFPLLKIRYLDAHANPWVIATNLIVFSPPCLGVPTGAVQTWLRSKFLDLEQGNLCAKGNSSILWLWRGSQGRRPVFGEKQAIQRLATFSIDILDCSKITVREQAQRIASSALIVAPHGGAMANLVFARPGAKVLELHHPNYAPPYFHSLIREQKLHLFAQAQSMTLPSIYRDLMFESSATEPIFLDSDAVCAAIADLM